MSETATNTSFVNCATVIEDLQGRIHSNQRDRHGFESGLYDARSFRKMKAIASARGQISGQSREMRYEV